MRGASLYNPLSPLLPLILSSHYTTSVLNSYFFGPHLDDEEEIVVAVHKHWLMGMRALWWPSVVFILVAGVLWFNHTKYVIYGISFAEVGVLIWWIRNFLDYFLDAWVITNKGIIDLEWHGWFHRSSARVLYSDIQGVSYEVNGIAGTLFGYGEMAVEKISTGSTINMPYVKTPRRVEAVILECMEAYMHKKNLKDSKTVQTILAEFVAGTLQKQAVENKRRPPVKR